MEQVVVMELINFLPRWIANCKNCKGKKRIEELKGILGRAIGLSFVPYEFVKQ